MLFLIAQLVHELACVEHVPSRLSEIFVDDALPVVSNEASHYLSVPVLRIDTSSKLRMISQAIVCA